MRRFFKRVVFLIAMALGLGIPLAHAGDPVNTKRGVALKGYDAVSYFTEGKPAKGSSSQIFEWQGASWHFVSEANRAAFAADPEKYAPQFGGYCAYAASEGYLYDASPNYWRIVDGKLYLNYNGSAQKRWEKDIPGNNEKAEGHGPRLIQ